MAASVNDKISKVSSGVRPVSTTVSTTRNNGATTLACADLTGWTTTEVVHFVTYSVDGSGVVVPGSQSDWKGVVSGSNITNLDLTGGADIGNQAGDIVELLPTAQWAKDLAENILEHTNQDGTLKDNAVTTSVIEDDAVTTAKIADGAVVTDTLADNAVTADKLSTGVLSDYIATAENTTSTTYTDLATVGPTVSVTVPASGKVLVFFGLTVSINRTANTALAVVELSGANTVAAGSGFSANTTIQISPKVSGGQATLQTTTLMTGLNPGSTTFKAKYRSTGSTGTYERRSLVVLPVA